jgi:hypothetical protein
MLTSRLVFLAVLLILWGASANADAQNSDKSPPSAKQQALPLNGTDNGKHVSAKVGQEIIITLQTIGPGQYETPRVSSSAVRFEGSYFPKEQNPGGPRQVYRFISTAVGEAKVEIPHSQGTKVYQITVRVKPD